MPLRRGVSALAGVLLLVSTVAACNDTSEKQHGNSSLRLLDTNYR